MVYSMYIDNNNNKPNREKGKMKMNKNKRYEVNIKENNVTVRDTALERDFHGKLIDGKLSANSSIDLKMVWKGLKENGIECK